MTSVPRRARGFSLIEVLGALALVAVVSVGAFAMIEAALEDTRAQHAGRHQQKVVEAAERYLRENYAALLAATGSAPVAIPMSALEAMLPEGFQADNAYGQTPCVRVMQPQSGRLNALIATEGGRSIPVKQLAYVAAQSGPGGGQIAATEPNVAKGAFGSWQVAVDAYGAAPCGVTVDPTINRLASALFFDGPSSSGSDFLYRTEVPGHPELNALEVPLGMRGAAVVSENDTTHPMCNAADPQAQGRIAVSADGLLLTCQAGAWRRQGSAFWRDPVADFASLPTAGNATGDVRLTRDTSRAFAWNGTGWKALAVDAEGDMRVPRSLLLEKSVALRDACDTDGALSRDANGLSMSCQKGLWRTQSVAEIDPAPRENAWHLVVPSAFMPYWPGAPIYGGPIDYLPAEDAYVATFRRDLKLEKAGQVTFNGWAMMARALVSDPTVRGKIKLLVEVFDRDTGALLAMSKAMSPILRNDTSTINTTLAKPLPVNGTGYELRVTLKWTPFNGDTGTPYNRSNYISYDGSVIEETPVQVGWTLDLTY